MEAIWEHMHQKAADELAGRRLHDLYAISLLDPVILPFECHGARISADEPMVRDGDPVCLA